MQYNEQLLQNEWQLKRKDILKRDSNKCINCHNSSYKNTFKSGIILSNIFIENTAKSIFYKDRLIIKIWDIEDGIVENSFLSEEVFDTNKTYIAFYEKLKYSNIVGLKVMDDLKIEFSKNIIDIAIHGIKGKFTEKTRDYITSNITANDNWDFIKGLHIHHTYYQHNKLAWEYDSNSLQTLCWVCHENLHKNEKIKVLDVYGIEIGEFTNCQRCFGSGYFPEFKHIQSGICFRCNGNRFEELIDKS